MVINRREKPSVVGIGITVLLALFVFNADLAFGGADESPYRLPLIGNFAVYRADVSMASRNKMGKFSLVEVATTSSGTYFGFRYILPKVEQIAVDGKLIVGRAANTFFIFNTGDLNPKPVVFDDLLTWQGALKSAGLSQSIQLADPDVMAANINDQILRPWDHRAIKEFAGLSDDMWSLIVQIGGLIAAFLVGVFRKKNVPVMGAAAGLGILVNIVAQIFIAGGGPGVCFGFVLLPIYFYVAAVLGKGARLLLGIERRAAALSA